MSTSMEVSPALAGRRRGWGLSGRLLLGGVVLTALALLAATRIATRVWVVPELLPNEDAVVRFTTPGKGGSWEGTARADPYSDFVLVNTPKGHWLVVCPTRNVVGIPSQRFRFLGVTGFDRDMLPGPRVGGIKVDGEVQVLEPGRSWKIEMRSLSGIVTLLDR